MLMTFFSRAIRTVLAITFAWLFAAHSALADTTAKTTPTATPTPTNTAVEKKKSPQKKQQVKKPAAKKTAKKTTATAAAAAAVVETSFTKRDEWHNIETFINEMVEKNQFDKTELTTLFSQLRFAEKIIPLVKPAPSTKPKDWQEYRARFIDPVRTQNGLQFWKEHADALKRAEKTYGVPAEVIVAIIGVETRYGRYTGNFRVLDVLTTLAFNYPDAPNRVSRMAFFLRELEHALLFARESHIDPLTLLGSYAGAIGWPQFMPGSIRAYAVDFDGDGVIDLRNSPVDAIGSVANFLKAHGWEEGLPTAFPATVPMDENDTAWTSLLGRGLKVISSVYDLTTVKVSSPVTIPTNLRYGLIDLQNANRPTEYWLVTSNFYAIAQYNRSYFYAMSVVDFSHALRDGYTAATNPK